MINLNTLIRHTIQFKHRIFKRLSMEQQQHILILPFPAQGHIQPMLCLAQLLCHAGLRVTFVNTDHNHRRLISNLRAIAARFPSLHFESISDGLPEDNPRDFHRFLELVVSLKNKTEPLFRDLAASLVKNNSDNKCPPVTCIIADGIMSFAIDVADELGIRLITFRTFSAACLWIYFCFPKLTSEGELPFGDDDLDKNIKCVPGMEDILRRRDLPCPYRAKQLDDPRLRFFVSETLSMTRSSTLILNTFDDLEAPALSQIATLFPKIYTLGPLHALLRSRVGDSHDPASFSGLWNADRSCLKWLDSQLPRSVVYVSFGSYATLTRVQLMEFWHGLISSGSSFLWVLRSNILQGSEDQNGVALRELKLWTRERGSFIVDWAPQDEVLAHQAVGGFLTHSGWNSTLEAIVAGVPLICWPQLADQMVNSRWAGEVWRIGLDMKDACERSTVETMVRAVMEHQSAAVVKSADRFARLARKSVARGGSSYFNLDRLIQDLKNMW